MKNNGKALGLLQMGPAGNATQAASAKKLKVVSDRYGCSIAYAQGYLEGEALRTRGAPPSDYARVGIDDFAVGFRAGYFLRTRRRSVPLAALNVKLVADSSRPDASSIVEEVPVLLSAS